MESLRRLEQEVAEELKGGHHDHAEHELHEMVDIARWLPEIAADSDMPEDQWNEVDAHAAELSDMLENARITIHDGESFDYSATQTRVAAIVESLQSIADDGAWNSGYFQTNEVAADSNSNPKGE